MKIGVIGGGTVGRATARCFLEHVDEVRVYDKDKNRSTHEITPAMDVDLCFICLPETALDEFWSEIKSDWFKQKNYVLKSTVPIGTTKRLAQKYNLPNLVHSPEFLTARCAVTDAQLPARNIIGAPNWTNRHTDTNPYLLRDLYAKRFPGVPILKMSSDESEAVKLIQNSFFAVKVAFFNEARSLCDAHGMDWNSVIAAVLADGRIAHSHTKVPGPDGKRGFGGACLPKDLEMFRQCCDGERVFPYMSTAAQNRNLDDRAKE